MTKPVVRAVKKCSAVIVGTFILLVTMPPITDQPHPASESALLAVSHCARNEVAAFCVNQDVLNSIGV